MAQREITGGATKAAADVENMASSTSEVDLEVRVEPAVPSDVAYPAGVILSFEWRAQRLRPPDLRSDALAARARDRQGWP